jgi:spore coat polysaccharide biosynthesis protein SpsF
MKIVAMIQARTGSTRLPGKVLKEIEGKTMLARVVERVRRARQINEFLVATTDHAADDAILAECKRLAVKVSRGDQDDVLDRYYRAAQLAKAEVVVRITSDCPLIDPEVIDKTVAAFLEAKPDYASNALDRTYPRGLDTEVMSFTALSRAWQEARKPYEREHVTPYIYEHPDKFKLLSVTGAADFSSHRWTVDTAEDLEFVRTIYARFKANPEFAGCEFSGRDVLDLLELEPELAEINRSVMQKALHEN